MWVSFISFFLTSRGRMKFLDHFILFYVFSTQKVYNLLLVAYEDESLSSLCLSLFVSEGYSIQSLCWYPSTLSLCRVIRMTQLLWSLVSNPSDSTDLKRTVLWLLFSQRVCLSFSLSLTLSLSLSLKGCPENVWQLDMYILLPDSHSGPFLSDL